MVRHVVIWKLKSGYSEDQKASVKENIKDKLEALTDICEGIVDIKVHVNGLESSNADIMLDSSFADSAALKTYASHPAHVKVATEDVVPFVAHRSCIDFEF